MISSLHVTNSIFLRPPLPFMEENPFMVNHLRGGGEGVESSPANSNMVNIIIFSMRCRRVLAASSRHVIIGQ